MNEIISNDLSLTILAQVLDEMKAQKGKNFSFQNVNLSELERLTGISRQRLRTLKKNGFVAVPHGRTGRKEPHSVLDGYTSVLDNLLKQGVTNSVVCLERLKECGFTGSLSTVKRYIASHKSLVPARRQLVAPQGSRGHRYTTSPGEYFQMDWGFINVSTPYGQEYTAACFAMICHHCGMRYVEFFPNAKQENLFIGMLHAFAYMGIPEYVRTDNMKSVVVRRDLEGNPVWQKDYEAFMRTVGFKTRLCKPRHPFTKGKVERLVRFVKENFLAGRQFWNYSDLNAAALEWCNNQNRNYQKAIDEIPENLHNNLCVGNLKVLAEDVEILKYLCPLRKISFDGFVNFEGRRFGIPYRHVGRLARICRRNDLISIYSEDLKELLVTHDVTWSKKDRYCVDQYPSLSPEELPTAPVKVLVKQLETKPKAIGFEKFNFSREV